MAGELDSLWVCSVLVAFRLCFVFVLYIGGVTVKQPRYALHMTNTLGMMTIMKETTSLCTIQIFAHNNAAEDESNKTLYISLKWLLIGSYSRPGSHCNLYASPLPCLQHKCDFRCSQSRCFLPLPSTLQYTDCPSHNIAREKKTSSPKQEQRKKSGRIFIPVSILDA